MIPLARPFAWYEYIWIVAPLVLVVGGAIGGACGAAAAYVNAQVLRSRLPLAVRLLIGVGVLVVAAALWLLLAMLLASAIR